MLGCRSSSVAQPNHTSLVSRPAPKNVAALPYNLTLVRTYVILNGQDRRNFGLVVLVHVEVDQACGARDGMDVATGLTTPVCRLMTPRWFGPGEGGAELALPGVTPAYPAPERRSPVMGRVHRRRTDRAEQVVRDLARCLGRLDRPKGPVCQLVQVGRGSRVE